MKRCCKGLSILLDTRNKSYKISDDFNLTKENSEFEILLTQILSKGLSSCFTLINRNWYDQLKQKICSIYNELFFQARPYNQLFIYDRSDSFLRLKLYRKSLERLARYEEAFSRLLYLNYKYMLESLSQDKQEVLFAVSKFSSIENIESLISQIKIVSRFIHAKLLKKFSSSYFVYPFLDLSSPNSMHIEIAEDYVFNRVLSCLKVNKGFAQNGIVILSKDPVEPYGGMCRYWNPKIPFLLFSPYYKGLFSALTLAHEIGHLIHYKRGYEKGSPISFPPIVEEFFAVYVELVCLKENIFDLADYVLDAIFWLRIWYLIVRQFRVFLFEKMNLSQSMNINLDSDTIRENWRKSWELILEHPLELRDISQNGWMISKGVMNLPFRSISYVLASLLALWVLLKGKTLDPHVYLAKDVKSLLSLLGLPSLEFMLKEITELICQ